MSLNLNLIPTSSTYARHIELEQANTEMVSDLLFLPNSSVFVSADWGGETRFWEVGPGGSRFFTVKKQNAPVLSLASLPSALTFASSLADGTILVTDLNKSTDSLVKGKHQACVPAINFLPGLNLLAAAGWDSSISFWDFRQETPVHRLVLPGRPVAMDASENALIFALHNRRLMGLNLRSNNLSVPVNIPTSLSTNFAADNAANSETEFPVQNVCVLAGEKSVAVGQSSGTVGIYSLQNLTGNSSLIQPAKEEKLLNLELHEKGNSIGYYAKKDFYSANSIAAYNVVGMFASSGGDGKTHFVDRYEGKKLFTIESHIEKKPTYMSSEEEPLPITKSCFDKGFTFFARAYSYDWSKGIKGYNKEKMKPRIFVNYKV